MKLMRAIISIAAVLTAFLILFGFLGQWLAVADAAAHFRFHLTVVMLMMAGLQVLQRQWVRAGLAAALSVAAVVGMAPSLPAWPGAGTVTANSTTVKTVQLNIYQHNSDPAAVADFIRSSNADIVTLQEVSGTTSRVMDILLAEYPNRVRCPYARVGSVAVLSRLPEARGEAKGCIEGGGMAWMRVLAGGQELSVATLHLHWPWPFQQNRQIGELEQYLQALPHPVVLAGDFNAAPWSHAVRRVAAAADASVVPGLRFSFGIRFGNWGPRLPLPIDHILLSGDITPLDIRLGPGPGSDHRSIIAQLALLPPKKEKLARK